MSELSQDTIGTLRTNDLLNLVLGDWLGEGEHRTVYRCAILPGYVVKIEKTAASVKRQFANINEWMVWTEVAVEDGKKWRKWLAPCHSISENGLVLIQKECAPLEYRPKRVPSFLADLKRSNWGTIDGKPVCFDYGNHASFVLVGQNAKLVDAKWHDKKSRPRVVVVKSDSSVSTKVACRFVDEIPTKSAD